MDLIQIKLFTLKTKISVLVCCLFREFRALWLVVFKNVLVLVVLFRNSSYNLLWSLENMYQIL